MKTPTQMNRSSASLSGMVPSATLSATAVATACCAGPNICTACLAFLMVTLLKRMVFGLQSRFGPITANRLVKPSLLLVIALQKAVSAALPRGPMIKSICATSLPSPISDSPTSVLLIFAILASPRYVVTEASMRAHPGLFHGRSTSHPRPFRSGKRRSSDHIFEVIGQQASNRQIGTGPWIEIARLELGIESEQPPPAFDPGSAPKPIAVQKIGLTADGLGGRGAVFTLNMAIRECS